MMKPIAENFLLLVSLFSLVAALPTKPPSLPVSLVDVSLQLNNTHLRSQIIHYSIPQTQYSIDITTGLAIDRSDMRETLETCLATVHARISKHGNVYMSPDPTVFTMPPKVDTGLEISVESTMVPGLLWTDVVNMLHGTLEVMIFHRAIYREARVELYDEPSGQKMGVAELYRSVKSTSTDPVETD